MHIYPTFRKLQFVSTTIHSIVNTRGLDNPPAMPDPTQDLWSVANASIPCASSNDQVTKQHFWPSKKTTNLATRLKPKNWGMETCKKKSIALLCDFLAKKKGGSIINPCLTIFLSWDFWDHIRRGSSIKKGDFLHGWCFHVLGGQTCYSKDAYFRAFGMQTQLWIQWHFFHTLSLDSIPPKKSHGSF